MSWCHYHWCLWIVNDKWFFVVLSYEINWWLILAKLLKFIFQLVFIWIELNIFVSLKMVFFFNVLHRGLRLNVELFACQWQAWQSQSKHPGHCDTVSLPSMITMSSIVCPTDSVLSDSNVRSFKPRSNVSQSQFFSFI